MNIPRPEHPKPQFERKNWLNLNGKWEFCFDEKLVGKAKKFYENHLESEIIVPFCPESKLSGIRDTDFHNCVWYRRDIEIPESWKGKRIRLHFGAVDYETTVYVNGKEVGTHKGGYSSFVFDITDFLQDKDNYISVCAVDDNRSPKQPSGKQSFRFESAGCFYTRTTGIWQTVWLEAVPETYLKNAKYYPDIHNGGVRIALTRAGYDASVVCRATAYYEGVEMGKAETKLDSLTAELYINLKETHLWEVGNGRLYDLKLELIKDGEITDTVSSYFGLRTIDLREKAFCINGKPVFGRWVLDQGFYPDGIYTAPTDKDLEADVINSMALGFNGARLHEKIFEERFMYHADKHGYLIWGEHANWGYYPTSMLDLNCFLPEWMESLGRDFNHPSIIGWCPFNETWDTADDVPQSVEVIQTIFNITKAVDSTRPVIDTSGNYHCKNYDIYDVHDYEQNVEKFAENYAKTSEGIVNDQVALSPKSNRQPYNGGQIFVSEYGGIRWSPESEEGWGYGNAPKTEQEFLERYKGLTDILLQNKDMMGFCYTQLYDVEQEVNGLMTYERKFKFDPEIIKKINTQIAEIEK